MSIMGFFIIQNNNAPWLATICNCAIEVCDLSNTQAERNEIFLNTSRPRQNGRHFADDISNCISLTENFWILNKIS